MLRSLGIATMSAFTSLVVMVTIFYCIPDKSTHIPDSSSDEFTLYDFLFPFIYTDPTKSMFAGLLLGIVIGCIFACFQLIVVSTYLGARYSMTPWQICMKILDWMVVFDL